MPTPLRRSPRNLAPPLRTELLGAGGSALQAANPAQFHRGRILGRLRSGRSFAHGQVNRQLRPLHGIGGHALLLGHPSSMAGDG
jgi:hypothetical protein